MVLTRTHGIDKDLWYRQQLMVLTTPMVLTKTHGIESVILNHIRMRGPSVTRMWDFFIPEVARRMGHPVFAKNIFFFAQSTNVYAPNATVFAQNTTAFAHKGLILSKNGSKWSQTDQRVQNGPKRVSNGPIWSKFL